MRMSSPGLPALVTLTPFLFFVFLASLPLADSAVASPKAASEADRGAVTSTPGAARDCVIYPLVSGFSLPVLQDSTHTVVPQNNAYWIAVGLRSDPGTDWDLEMHSASGGATASPASWPPPNTRRSTRTSSWVITTT